MLRRSILFALFSALLPIACSATVVRVSPGGFYTGSGITWSDTKDLPSAMKAAHSGDEIWVQAGTYGLNADAIPAGVALYGGFTGTETDRSQRNPAIAVTQLDVGYSQSNSGVIYIPYDNCVLDGFTIKNGMAMGNGGGGVYCTGHGATISHNIITANDADPRSSTPGYGYGGGIYVNGGSATISNNLISYNNAVISGGGIVVRGGATATIRNNTVVGNTAVTVTNVHSTTPGAGISIGGTSTVTVVNNIVALNESGISVEAGSTASFSNNDVWNNAGVDYSGVTGVTGSNGNISADPLFKDGGNADFRLQSGSPALEAGSNSAVSTGDVDLLFAPRWQGPHPDLGAYESAPDSQVLTFGAQPNSGSGAPFVPQPVVTVGGPNGSSYNGPVTISVVASSAPPGTVVNGTSTVLAHNGVATFAGLGVTGPIRGLILEARTPDGLHGMSAPFNIFGPAVALSFTTQPQTSVHGLPVRPTPVVSAVDAAGNADSNFSGTVTMSLSQPSGLSGTVSTNAVAGVATFSNVIVNSTGTGLKLTASANGLTPATSLPFDVRQRVFYVRPNGPGGDGASWATAFPSTAYLANALPGAEGWIAAGTYTVGTTVAPGVSLYGGFSGTETSRDQRQPAANPTTISGTSTIAGTVEYPTTIDGFTIRDGTGVTVATGGDSGNISGETRGAGLYISSGTVIVSHDTLTNNHNGYFHYSVPPHSSFDYYPGEGGAIYVASGNVTISDSVITNNSGTDGAAVANRATGDTPTGSVTILRCAITGNGGDSSLLYQVGTLLDSVVAGNYGISVKGTIHSNIANNTFVSNQGSSVFNVTSDTVVANNIVDSNYNYTGAPEGFSTFFGAPGPAVRNNCFFNEPDVDSTGLIGHAGNIEADPLFVNRTSGDYHLSPASPCIDRGSNADVPDGSLDLDGHARIQGLSVDIGAYEFTGSAVTMADAANALRIAGGLLAAGPSDVSKLNASPSQDGSTRVELLDAVQLARKVAGIGG